MQQGYRVYEHARITTADRGRLLLMLYEGGIDFLREGERRMRQGDDVKARYYQAKAFNIVTELMNTLDHQVGGEIAANLSRLYAFMLHHLSEGNARQAPQHFADVAHLLAILHDAFAQAVAMVARPTATAHRAIAGAA